MEEQINIHATASKRHALARFLGMDWQDLEQSEDNRTFTNGVHEYLVLTEDEANEACRENILETLWAFKPSWIAQYVNLDDHAHKALIEILSMAQDKYCETLNPIIQLFIKGKEDKFIHDSIEADGRGHFLAPYDFEENEEGEYFIYRIN